MKIKTIGFDKPAVVVLGAGATRGASFVGQDRAIRPPLDGDFFTQAQRLSKNKPGKLLQDVISHAVDLFGSNFRVTMEGFLTQVEHLSNVFNDYKLQGRPTGNPYPEIREQFLQLLAAVLDETIGRHPECEYHRHLVQALGPDDVVASFNYDWLIDHTLKTHGADKWSPRIGYGVDVYRDGGCDYWACKDNNGGPVWSAASITLLKMHGALTWFPVTRDPPKLKLRQRWWHQYGRLRFEIAPPEWNKPIRSGVYRPIWRTARANLRDTTALVFVGYSLPATDIPAQALFRIDSVKDAKAKKLQLLVIVNPDREARERIRHTLLSRIDRKTRVLVFDLFEDFAEFLNQ